MGAWTKSPTLCRASRALLQQGTQKKLALGIKGGATAPFSCTAPAPCPSAHPDWSTKRSNLLASCQIHGTAAAGSCWPWPPCRPPSGPPLPVSCLILATSLSVATCHQHMYKQAGSAARSAPDGGQSRSLRACMHAYWTKVWGLAAARLAPRGSCTHSQQPTASKHVAEASWHSLPAKQASRPRS